MLIYINPSAKRGSATAPVPVYAFFFWKWKKMSINFVTYHKHKLAVSKLVALF